MSDRDILRRRKKLRRISEDESQKLIYRNMFIAGKDAEIARSVSNFFVAVSKKWPEAWLERKSGNILNRTNGLRALMRFHRDCYLFSGGPGIVVSTSKYLSILKRIKLDDADFTPENYHPGTSGERQLHRDLLKQSKIPTD